MHGSPEAFVQMYVAVNWCAILPHQYFASTIMDNHGHISIKIGHNFGHWRLKTKM